MTAGPARVVAEVPPAAGDLPLWVHPEWQERFPWLVQGTTGRGDAAAPFDLGLFGAQPVGEVVSRWERLREATGIRRAVHSRQVHRAEIQVHATGAAAGLLIGSGYDGHATREAGVLLTVSVADCVPVYVVDAASRALALLHAGWRGVAAGIVERGLEWIRGGEGGASAREFWLHCGPSICGRCYEVGPEVHAAVRPDRSPPSSPTPIDLRAAIATRAVAAGVDAARLTESAHCTRCGPGEFFSHRGGSAGRQMAVMGRKF